MTEGVLAFLDGDFLYHMTRDAEIKIKFDKMVLKIEENFSPFLRAYYYAGIQKPENETTIRFRDFLRYNGLNVIECPVLNSNEEGKQDRSMISLQMSIDIVGKPLSMQKQNIVEIVVITNSTDVTQAMKFIKECGVKVHLICNENKISAELKKTADTCQDLFNFIGEKCIEKL